MNIVALGDDFFITNFRLAGVPGFVVNNEEEARNKIEEIIKEGKCKIVVISESMAIKLKKDREKWRERVYPIFAIVPGLEGPKGERLHELYFLVSQAVGVKLKLE
ncbi:MAG: V-type ATP synthase subunit F [Nitrososphaerales archaeon]